VVLKRDSNRVDPIRFREPHCKETPEMPVPAPSSFGGCGLRTTAVGEKEPSILVAISAVYRYIKGEFQHGRMLGQVSGSSSGQRYATFGLMVVLWSLMACHP
jgi:hypothetical protein